MQADVLNLPGLFLCNSRAEVTTEDKFSLKGRETREIRIYLGTKTVI